MRIFHLSSLHGPFVAHELIYILRSPDRISPFPFTQSDLYELHQPALCLIDAHTELYIWQGWNDVFDDDLGLQLSQANLVAAGPRDIRFTAERRCAFRTVVDYCQSTTRPKSLSTTMTDVFLPFSSEIRLIDDRRALFNCLCWFRTSRVHQLISQVDRAYESSATESSGVLPRGDVSRSRANLSFES